MPSYVYFIEVPHKKNVGLYHHLPYYRFFFYTFFFFFKSECHLLLCFSIEELIYIALMKRRQGVCGRLEVVSDDFKVGNVLVFAN